MVGGICWELLVYFCVGSFDYVQYRVYTEIIIKSSLDPTTISSHMHDSS